MQISINKQQHKAELKNSNSMCKDTDIFTKPHPGEVTQLKWESKYAFI